MKVRVGSRYVFDPCFLDHVDSRTKAKKGDIVRVVNMPGCPKANTFGHCYIETLDGEFLGMVSTNSLRKVTK